MSAENDRRPQNNAETEETPENVLANKIVMYYGYFEEHSLKGIAKTCAKLIISEHYRDLCFDNFEFPSHEEMKSWVLEEMKQNFDEKVVPLVEQAYPHLSEAELDNEIARLEKKYEKEHGERLESTARAALKELRVRVRGLQKELKELRRKYTI
ncbi:hypothetical protein QUF72_20590 [Desulfobacterales bacterium HSG2]|nr:hypothetical protein [Desulfobacterales bacterium HSG2]